MPIKEVDLLYCAHCGWPADILIDGPVRFRFRIRCHSFKCGIGTPHCATMQIAAGIWQRRLQRKPPRHTPLLTSPPTHGKLATRTGDHRQPGKARRKRATASKGAHTQRSSR